MFKKLVSIILALTSCLCFSAAAMAAKPAERAPIAAPRLVSGNSVQSVLRFSGNTAELYTNVTGKDGTTQIVVTQVLQQKTASGYRDVSGAKWTKTYRSMSSDTDNRFTVRSAGTYRIKATAKITGPNGTDTVTKNSSDVTYR